jgi:hypothetical protein
MRKGKRNVKIMPMLSSAITLNMIVLFFKKGLLLHLCDFVVITQLAFVLYMKACLCIVPGSIDYMLHEEHFVCFREMSTVPTVAGPIHPLACLVPVVVCR